MKRLNHVFILAAIAALLAALFLGCFDKPSWRGNSMNREQLSEMDFRKSLNKMLEMPVYKVTSKEKKISVVFALKLPPYLIDDSLLTIESNTQEALIYRGRWQEHMNLQVDDKFLDSHGYDSLRFLIFKEKTHEVFVAEQEAQFWQDGKKIIIELLPERVIDEKIGIPISFRITAE